MDWIYFSMLSHYLCQMKLYMPAAVAMLCQSWATSPLCVYPYQGRAKCHGNRCMLTSLALSKGEAAWMHTYLRGWKPCSNLPVQFSCSTRDLQRESLQVAMIGTVIKHQPSFPSKPPRNCLTVQFLPYVHLLFSHLPLSEQLVSVCL